MRVRAAIALLLVSPIAFASIAQAQARPATQAELDGFFEYIHRSWAVLGRDHRQLLQAAIDPKLPRPPRRWPVYVAPDEDLGAIRDQLRRELPAMEFTRVEVRTLPADGSQPKQPGILYLPRPYVVPGGRFNEMYGWDSYFILRGLLREGLVDRARDLVDDFVYEVRHYGKVLNANRSYYLTRSQPPFVASMVRAVFDRTGDRSWLADVLPAAIASHDYFTRGEHRTPTGLSRYFDAGLGPAPEVMAGERDAAGRSHYDRVRQFFRQHPSNDDDNAALYDRASDRLTDRFYVADRSMRESGFDPSGRFGPFNAGVLDYDPVCLNSLLYLEEQQIAELWGTLGHPALTAGWRALARRRAARINALLWDEQAGLYYDYDYVHERRRAYPFLTTFFPLWVGLASPAQAARVARNLPLFETLGGLRTSTIETGMQWDSPYGWAPLQLIAFEGLRRYGYHAEAERIGAKFFATVLAGFVEQGAIFEKYDVLSGRAEIAAGLRFGYTSNEIGFGWTNAVVLEIWNELSELGRRRATQIDAQPDTHFGAPPPLR
jgi:alpha,alpha-trehalase